MPPVATGLFSPLPPVSYATDCDQRALVSNYTYAVFFSQSIKIRGLLEYVYVG